MLDILQFYVSGFWVWLGITLGISIAGHAVARIVIAFWGKDIGEIALVKVDRR